MYFEKSMTDSVWLGLLDLDRATVSPDGLGDLKYVSGLTSVINSEMEQSFSGQHYGSFNGCFADGHVEFINKIIDIEVFSKMGDVRYDQISF